MRYSAKRFAIVFLVLGFLGSTSAVIEADGRVHGLVADESGGVLPGVTVVATSADGRVLASVVTDDVGRYAFAGLPDGVRLTFQLEGFSPAVVDVAVKPDGDSPVATQRLLIAPRSETVIVQGKAPVEAPPAPPRAPLPASPPPPVLLPVPDHDRDSVCGPAKANAFAESFGTIRSRRYAGENALYAQGDELFIDGGTATGLEAGQNVVARRTYRVASASSGMTGEHTAGVLQIVTAGERASIAVVIYACDELMRGDRLEAFTPEPLRAPEPNGMPAYDNAARILFADAGQMVGAPRRLMVIDRGSHNGIRAGQPLTLFRRARHSGERAIVGDAVVVAVRSDSATIRIERASDAITLGDFAAPPR